MVTLWTFKFAEKFKKNATSEKRPSVRHTVSYVRSPSNHNPESDSSAQLLPSLDMASSGSCQSQTETTRCLKRAPTWLRRSISFDGVVQQDPPVVDSASFEELLRLQLCDVKAWKPMPSYFVGSTFVIPSEGEIVDPFDEDRKASAKSRPSSCDPCLL